MIKISDDNNIKTKPSWRNKDTINSFFGINKGAKRLLRVCNYGWPSSTAFNSSLPNIGPFFSKAKSATQTQGFFNTGFMASIVTSRHIGLSASKQ